MEKWADFFVPGRLCLFGEHSDWAAGHRRQNSELEKGYAIVAPTNQGTYICARKNKGMFKVKSTLDEMIFEIPMNKEALRKEAEKGGLFSYGAGVAYYIIERYCGSDGIYIDNYKTDLPIKKGLSSSASFCVGVARSFNQIYNLKLTPNGEMDLAYRGEVLTPSRCGRMDQACAYNNPVIMKFDADFFEIEQLSIGKDMYLLVVDLNGSKDTKRILHDLNRSYPFAQNGNDKRVQDYLGKINKDIVFQAKDALVRGDDADVGAFMREAQSRFDEALMPQCEELRALKLHHVLEHKPIQQFIYGGKGVGSQGDGCAQFICCGEEERKEVSEILKREFDFRCYELDLKRYRELRLYEL